MNTDHPLEIWLERKTDEVLSKIDKEVLSNEEMLVLIVKSQNELIKKLLKESQKS